MNEEYPEEKLSNNPIHSWLRVILWLIPISFCIPSVAIKLAGMYLGLDETITDLLSFGSVVFFLIGAGWCDFKLSGPEWKKSFNLAGSVVFYFFGSSILAMIIFCPLATLGFFD